MEKRLKYISLDSAGFKPDDLSFLGATCMLGWFDAIQRVKLIAYNPYDTANIPCRCLNMAKSHH